MISGSSKPIIAILLDEETYEEEKKFFRGVVPVLGLQGLPVCYGSVTDLGTALKCIKESVQRGVGVIIACGDTRSYLKLEQPIQDSSGLVLLPCFGNPSGIGQDAKILETFVKAKEEAQEIVQVKRKNYKFLFEIEEIDEFLDWAPNEKVWAIDIETTPHSPYHKDFDLVSISFSNKKDYSYAFGLIHPEARMRFTRPYWSVWEKLKRFLSTPDIRWIGHNILKFDKIGLETILQIQMSVNTQDLLNRFDDTMIMKYTLNESAKGRYSLKKCGKEELGWADWGIDTGALRDKPLREVLKYNCADTDATFQLYEIYLEKFENNSKVYMTSLYDSYKKLLLPTATNAAILDFNGIKGNRKYASSYEQKSEKKLEILSEQVKSFKHVKILELQKRIELVKTRKNLPIQGTPQWIKWQEILDRDSNFKVTSRDQIRYLLYNVLKLTYNEEFGRTDKKGDQKITEESLLWTAENEKRNGNRELYRFCLCLKYIQSISKDLSNYIRPVLINSSRTRDGLSHPSFLPTGTETGRYSCKNADSGSDSASDACGENLQKVDKRPMIRNLYKSRFDRGYLVQIDGQAAEVRFATLHSIASPSVVAQRHPLNPGEYFSNKYHYKWREEYLQKASEHKLVQAFSTGLDIHTAGTAIIMNKDPKDVTESERKDGKTVTLGRQFARGHVSIAAQYGIDEEVMRKRVELWDNTFPAFSQEWHPAVKKWVSEYGFVVSLFGLVRRLPDIWHDLDKWRHKAIREAINSPVQGDSHFWISRAMTWFQINIIDSGYVKKARIINDIHDAFMVDCPEEELDRVAVGMAQSMLHLYWDHDNYPWVCCDLAGDLEVFEPWGVGRVKIPFNTCFLDGKDRPDFNVWEALSEIWFKGKEKLKVL